MPAQGADGAATWFRRAEINDSEINDSDPLKSYRRAEINDSEINDSDPLKLQGFVD